MYGISDKFALNAAVGDRGRISKRSTGTSLFKLLNDCCNSYEMKGLLFIVYLELEAGLVNLLPSALVVLSMHAVTVNVRRGGTFRLSAKRSVTPGRQKRLIHSV